MEEIKKKIFDILLNHSHASRTRATEEIAALFNERQTGAVWVKGAPKERKQHFAKVPCPIDDNLFHDAIIWPTQRAGHWYAAGNGFNFVVHDNEVIAYLDESPAAAREEDAVEFAEWVQENAVAQYENKQLHSWRIFEPYTDNIDYTSAQLYDIFKQQKEK